MIDSTNNNKIKKNQFGSFLFYYNGNIAVVNPHSINNDNVSSIVVINGLAITAGSNLHCFAISGKVQPTILATKTVINIARHTTADTR